MKIVSLIITKAVLIIAAVSFLVSAYAELRIGNYQAAVGDALVALGDASLIALIFIDEKKHPSIDRKKIWLLGVTLCACGSLILYGALIQQARSLG